MRRFAVLTVVTALVWCPLAGAQEVILVLRTAVEAKPFVKPQVDEKSTITGSLYKFPEDVWIGQDAKNAPISIAKTDLLAIVYDNSNDKDLRKTATIVYYKSKDRKVVKTTRCRLFASPGTPDAPALELAFNLNTTAGPRPHYDFDTLAGVYFKQPADATPKADKSAAADDKCSPPGAFDYLPRVDPVEKLPKGGTGSLSSQKSGEPACSTKGACEHRFRDPAHFPVPQFGVEAESYESGALVIYEGMQLLAFPDGRYELSFTATISDIPATLRLQFTVQDLNHEKHPFQINVPPIAIYGAVAADGNYRGRTVQVRHVGFSGELRNLADAYGNTVPQLNVHRDGVARFGTLPTTN